MTNTTRRSTDTNAVFFLCCMEYPKVKMPIVKYLFLWNVLFYRVYLPQNLLVFITFVELK